MINAQHSFTFLDSDGAVADHTPALLDAADGALVAIDIEEDREYRYTPCVALIQITIGDVDVVLDPLTVSAELLVPVVEFLCLGAHSVVMHGCVNDVGGLKRDFGVGPASVCDTQIASRFLGTSAFGLSALLESRFGVVLDKSTRRSNWLSRPLTAQQIAYARADTTHLLHLWEALEADVEAAGWADALREECDAMAAIPAETRGFDAFGWQRLRGVRGLEDDARRRLAAAWRWRDDVGAQLDLHPSQVMPPWALMRVAEIGVAAVHGLARKGLHTSVGEEPVTRLLSALDDPPPIPRQPRALRAWSGNAVSPDVFDARMPRFLSWRDRVATQTGLDPGFLAPRTVLEALARADVDAPSGYDVLSEVRDWRRRRWADEWFALR